MSLPNFPILAASAGINGTFTIAGDLTSIFLPADLISEATRFTISGTLQNDGIYEAASSLYAAGVTIITVNGAVPFNSNIPAGAIIYVTVFQVDFPSATKPPIVIRPNTVDNSLSLTLPGRNSTNWAEYFLEGFLRLLDNSFNDAPPPNPTLGQHWYDSANNLMKVNTPGGWRVLSYSAVTPVGSATAGYVHHQPVAASTWTIPHNLGTVNIVYAVYQLDDSQILPMDISMNSASLTIFFSSPIQGRAVITAVI